MLQVQIIVHYIIVVYLVIITTHTHIYIYIYTHTCKHTHTYPHTLSHTYKYYSTHAHTQSHTHAHIHNSLLPTLRSPISLSLSNYLPSLKLTTIPTTIIQTLKQYPMSILSSYIYYLFHFHFIT